MFRAYACLTDSFLVHETEQICAFFAFADSHDLKSDMDSLMRNVCLQPLRPAEVGSAPVISVDVKALIDPLI
jgi:hypothetical protein